MTRDRLERWADRLARSASKDPDPLLLMRFGMVSGVLMMGIACLPAVSSPLVFLMGAYSLMSTRHLLERAGFIRMLERRPSAPDAAPEQSNREWPS
jgi:hypothetical protein